MLLFLCFVVLKGVNEPLSMVEVIFFVLDPACPPNLGDLAGA